ncbi:hypothetical protein [Aeromonas veronii]|uniref:hypothetical protein n=1 Tax=Aeromonas veronii TaxID=654 RepID=UPI003D1DD1F7
MNIASRLNETTYLQVAHWLYQQQRAISAREAAEVLGGSTWLMSQHFSKIKKAPDIILSDEQKIPSKGGKQVLLRVIHIYPYRLDEYQQPHRVLSELERCQIPLTWHDLVSRPWHQLVARHYNKMVF